ncbi:hypothetical protein [uncultured Thiodictyon sp.]|jgi:hypothetical protein|uniref:hypothetical protein n=1 Tax=uncultured Thiodictyon sp. TaxID=1846217 RepID=UPI0025E59ADF|nr:hypothetical protein [uncultured Thiodictyon sp.]
MTKPGFAVAAIPEGLPAILTITHKNLLGLVVPGDQGHGPPAGLAEALIDPGGDRRGLGVGSGDRPAVCCGSGRRSATA